MNHQERYRAEGMAQAVREKDYRDMTPEQLDKCAEFVHAVHAAYCKFIDESEVPYFDKASIIDGLKMESGHQLISPSRSHDNWMAFKLKDGWRYGEKKDREAKTHPCLLPFQFLPRTEQLKDDVFNFAKNIAKKVIFNFPY